MMMITSRIVIITVIHCHAIINRWSLELPTFFHHHQLAEVYYMDIGLLHRLAQCMVLAHTRPCSAHLYSCILSSLFGKGERETTLGSIQVVVTSRLQKKVSWLIGLPQSAF